MAPNIVMRFSSPNYTGNHWALVDSYSQLEVVIECVLIYLIQGCLHCECQIHASLQVLPDVIFRLEKFRKIIRNWLRKVSAPNSDDVTKPHHILKIMVPCSTCKNFSLYLTQKIHELGFIPHGLFWKQVFHLAAMKYPSLLHRPR